MGNEKWTSRRHGVQAEEPRARRAKQQRRSRLGIVATSSAKVFRNGSVTRRRTEPQLRSRLYTVATSNEKVAAKAKKYVRGFCMFVLLSLSHFFGDRLFSESAETRQKSCWGELTRLGFQQHPS